MHSIVHTRSCENARETKCEVQKTQTPSFSKNTILMPRYAKPKHKLANLDTSSSCNEQKTIKKAKLDAMKIAKSILVATCLSYLLLGSSAGVCFIPSLKRNRISTRKQQILSLRSSDPNDNVVDSSDSEFKDVASNVNRRTLLSTLGASGALLSGPSFHEAVAASDTDIPLADLPMKRLRLPGSGVGRDYIIVQLMIKGEGPFDFMIDSGLTTELITPHLQQTLGIGIDSKKKPMVTGLGAGGSTQGGQLVELKGAALCCGKFAQPGASELPLPSLYAVVTDFPQEHIDPQHDPVEGMLGMEMLDLFDADFDFRAGRFRLWAPGSAAKAAAKAGLVEIPAIVINESGLLGIRVESLLNQKQPVLGIIDCGASFSALNWQAAEILGLPTDRNAYRNEPVVATLGVDGRMQNMPTKEVQLTFAGNASKDSSGSFQFDAPPKNWKPWDAVRLGIADLPVFSQLLGDGVTPYKGPAALIGLDVLSQRRLILETGKTRARRLFVAPS